MALLQNCFVCDKITLHSSLGECIACTERQKKEMKEKWLKMSDKQKISDLFSRVMKLEEIIQKSYFSQKF